MATAGKKGISNWMGANPTTKPIWRRFYEITIKSALGSDRRRPIRHSRAHETVKFLALDVVKFKVHDSLHCTGHHALTEGMYISFAITLDPSFESILSLASVSLTFKLCEGGNLGGKVVENRRLNCPKTAVSDREVVQSRDEAIMLKNSPFMLC